MTTPNQPLPDTVETLLGIGAFEIGGADTNYGQDITEDFVNNLVKLPYATFDNYMDVLTEALSRLPIEALEAFKPLVPDWLEDEVLDVAQAVTKIVNALTPKEILAKLIELQALMEAIFGALTGGGDGLPDLPFDDVIGIIENLLEAIPFANIVGVGGPQDIGTSLIETWNQLIGGLVGSVGSGAGLADLFNVGRDISSRASLGQFSWDILGIRNNKTMATGMLPTSVSPMVLTDVGSGASATTFGINSSTATTLWHRFEEAMSLGVISWLGYGTTNITDMRVNIWKMDTTTGDATLAYSSANIVGDVSNSASPQYNTHELSTPIAVEATDVYGAEICVRAGTGTHNIVGKQFWLPSHPTVYPRKFWSKRNPGGTAPPSTIASASIDYTATNAPAIEFAVEAGPGSEFHSPITVEFDTPGTLTYPIPSWAKYVEALALGSGGAGYPGSSTFGINGVGGGAGEWSTATWERDVDFTGATSVTVTVAAGASSSGISGGTSSAAIPGLSVEGVGGAGGSSWGGPSEGQSPGNKTYGDGDPTYVGGGKQYTLGAAGAAPGGGGAGGGYYPFLPPPGGPGADGSVWLRFRQG